MEPSVTLEGELTLAPAGPLDDTVVLADAGGTFCALRSPALEYELRSLAGHRARVTGRLMGRTANGPELLVERYSLAPTNGREPIIGVLESRGDGIVLVQSESGSAYAAGGPLEAALSHFAGYKVWISGPLLPAEQNPRRLPTVMVESYGVMVIATGITSGEP
jgi:hypothetical protein